ncbi:MAG: membrane protein insertion efficiency factor YidD [Candidatus Eisenbacteria bacterium]|uniref:Membrane protein insertion efficiency factor YidD n=1 Tax=Eiseniibacteriota bacterium TaxID=2212470 RepID=A0A933SDT0_UNCEI|nr:membrane protein insertion efficiency factor YidD [Candidatus Eisenbacteria bacterium]
MKHWVEQLILAYQRTPALRRRKCLFRESCSNYVLRRLREDGVLAAFKAFAERWARCRPGFEVKWNIYAGTATVRLADGSRVSADELVLGCVNHRSSLGGKTPVAPPGELTNPVRPRCQL